MVGTITRLACLGSKALAEASYSQLGMLAFKNMAKSGEN